MERLRRGSDPGSAIDGPFRIVHRAAGSTTSVTRVRVQTSSGPSDLFVKRYVPPDRQPETIARVQRYFTSECQRSAQACTALAGQPSLRAPTVLASFPDLLVIVSAAEEGVGLDRVLRSALLFGREPAIRRATGALVRVGEWVRRFQAGVPIRNGRTPRDVREYIDVRLRGLGARGHRSFRDADRSALLEVVDRLIASIPPDDFRVVAVHADLCPANILVRHDGISVLDFQMSSDGNRMADLAHLRFHVYKSAARWRGGADIRSRLERALLSGYEAGLNGAHPLFKLMTLQQNVCWLTEIGASMSPRARLLGPLLMRRRVADVVGSATRLLEEGDGAAAVRKVPTGATI
jgi:ribosome modulation factor